MKQFIRFIKSDWYKWMHSSLLFIHLFVPILGVVVFISYYTVSALDDIQKVSAYLQVLAMAFPLLIGIVTAIVSEQEMQAGSCQMLLSAPCKKCIPHFAKLVIILIFGFLSSIIAVLGFGIVFRLMGNIEFNLSMYMKASLLLFVGNIPLYLLQYTVSFAFGKGIGLGLGIVGSLLSALLLTELGDYIWMILPWSIATRFCSMFVESEFANTSFVNLAGVTKGIMYLVISSVVLLLILNIWSIKWNGRKNEAN